jgi:hypothetical protein
MDAAHGGVERREQLIRGERAGAGEAIEQRRLARVRVADERNGSHCGSPPRAALGGALADDLSQAFVQHLDACSQQAAVGLELLFARAAQTDAAFLALEVGPASDEAGELMLDLGELDLQFAFCALRAQREDVEDERRPVDDAAVECALEIALLGAGQRMIEDDQIGVGLGAPRADFLDFALARKKRRIGSLPPTRDCAGHGGAGRHGKGVQLREALALISRPKVERDQQRAVTARELPRTLVDQCGKAESRGRARSGIRVGCRRVVRHGDGARGYNGRNGVLVDHLRDRVLEQDHILVERLDLSLQLDAVDEINGHLNVLFAQRVQEGVLQHLPFVAHLRGSALVVGLGCAPAGPASYMGTGDRNVNGLGA